MVHDLIFPSYNGTARGLINCNEGGCARCNGSLLPGKALYECICLHAEENALLEAGRERVGAGAVIYCNTLASKIHIFSVDLD
jgi:dCMP deaminase